MGTLVGGDGSWMGCRRRLDGRPERPTEASYNAHGHRAPTKRQLAKTITCDGSKQSSLVPAELCTAAVRAHSSRRGKLRSADSYLTMPSKCFFHSCESTLAVYAHVASLCRMEALVGTGSTAFPSPNFRQYFTVSTSFITVMCGTYLLQSIMQ